MTANELADELQKLFVGEEYDRLVHEIPDLLRQQEAELNEAGHMIGVLREEISLLKEALKKELALQKLSDIGQEIENEPVAWMTENGTIFDELPPISGGLIPLYTHPTDTIPYKDLHQVVKNVLAQPMRELTDEEIDANRYQWLRNEFANGRETYLAEGIPIGEQLDKYIDEQLKKASDK
jgi:hypothetical protein